MLDFLRHCRRFSFHERDFRSSLLRLRKSSLFVSSSLSVPNQIFSSFLPVGYQPLRYTLQGESFTHPSPPLFFFCLITESCLIVFCVVSDMLADQGDWLFIVASVVEAMSVEEEVPLRSSSGSRIPRGLRSDRGSRLTTMAPSSSSVG